jgi:DNA-binding MarR family transcriptional regulator
MAELRESGPAGAGALAGEPTAEEFLDAFDSLARAVRRARGASASGRSHPLTVSQYGLLVPLTDRPQARIGDLAEAAGITAATATRILDALERRGIVRRMRSSGDRRGVIVALTDPGRGTLERQHAWMVERQRLFYADLAADERDLAPGLLRKLADLIDELASPSADE